MPDLSIFQWLLGAMSAWLVGVAKTGIPGLGILIVPLMALAFGGRLSVGTLLPMLIFADCFAVAWYRQHTQWSRLWGLFPWVALGIGLGALALWQLGEQNGRDYLNPLIGALVLSMLSFSLLRKRLGERFEPHTALSKGFTGTLAGFATTASNAAGPVMAVYLSAQKLPKEQFVGTNAWFFFLLNVSKVPIFVLLTLLNPQKPLFTAQGLLFNLLIAPVILLGVWNGRWMLKRIPQHWFDVWVLILAALASVQLLFQ